VAAATDCDGRWSVQGFDAASGAYRWRADLPGRFAADQLSGAGGTVVVRVTGDANALAGLDVASGRVRWRADLGDVPVGAADLRADPVVVAQQPGIGATTRLRAFGRGDGTVRWDQTAVGERGVLGLVDAPEAVAALALNPADPPSVVGLDPASGGLRWEVPGAGLTAGAAAAGGVTTATRPAGGVVGIDLATGAVRWERPDLVDPFVPLGLAVASGDVVLAGLAATGAVQAVRLADGATGWPAGDGEAPGGAGPGGFALVGAGDGGQTVARVVRADGSALGTTSPLPPPDEVQPLVVGADGTAYVGRSCPGTG
jgi:outer membrane protein assembly factor BamB